MKTTIGLIALFVLAVLPATQARADFEQAPPQAPAVIAAPLQAPPLADCACGGVGPCECGPGCTCKASYRSIMADVDQPAQAPKVGAVKGFDGWSYCEDGYHHKASGWCQSSETGLYFQKSTPGVFYSFEKMKAKCAADCQGDACANGQCSPQGFQGGDCGASMGYGTSYGVGSSYGVQGSKGGFFQRPVFHPFGGKFGKGGGGGGCGKGG
jgi:hypothetical protein